MFLNTSENNLCNEYFFNLYITVSTQSPLFIYLSSFDLLEIMPSKFWCADRKDEKLYGPFSKTGWFSPYLPQIIAW